MFALKPRINAEIHIIDQYLKMHSSCDVSFNQYKLTIV